jgi:hypothetical protein
VSCPSFPHPTSSYPNADARLVTGPEQTYTRIVQRHHQASSGWKNSICDYFFQSESQEKEMMFENR